MHCMGVMEFGIYKLGGNGCNKASGWSGDHGGCTSGTQSFTGDAAFADMNKTSPTTEHLASVEHCKVRIRPAYRIACIDCS